MIERLSERLDSLFREALEEHWQEDAVYDIALLPSDQGPVAMLYVTVPGALLGTVLSGMFQHPQPSKIEGPEMQQIVVGMLEAVQEGRSKQLAVGNGQKASQPQGGLQGLGPLIDPLNPSGGDSGPLGRI